MNFLSKEIAVLAISFMGTGVWAWNDVTTDVSSNTAVIEQQEKRNTERYEDLKDGQERMQDLLEKLLLREHGDGGSEQ